MAEKPVTGDYYRFHRPHLPLTSPFGTPGFLVGQTVIFAAWIAANVAGFVHFDLHPFILLNLAFSLQAAYAAPLILLAQTRQADREKAHADADAQHREDLARANAERQAVAALQNDKLRLLLEANTQLTEQVRQAADRIDTLTREIHGKLLASS